MSRQVFVATSIPKASLPYV